VIRCGGVVCTSLAAVQRFFTALTGEQETVQAAPRAAGKGHAKAEKALDLAGI